jgi:hypothetical protein
MKTLSLVLHLSFMILVSSASAKPNVLFIISDDLTDTNGTGLSPFSSETGDGKPAEVR